MSEEPIKLNLDTVVQLSQNLMSCDISSERVILEVSSGQYFNLNETAKRICCLLDKPLSVRDLIDAVSAMHDVTRQQCEKDMLSFLEDLHRSQIIQIYQ